MRMLYRQLLRCSRRVDGHPVAQLIFRNEVRGVEHASSAADALYQLWLERLLGRGRCYMMPEGGTPSRAHRMRGRAPRKPVSQAVKDCFRMGFELQRTNGSGTINRATAVEAGLRIMDLLVHVSVAAEEMGISREQLQLYQKSLQRAAASRAPPAPRAPPAGGARKAAGWWVQALEELLPPEAQRSAVDRALLAGCRPARVPCPGVFLIEHPLADNPLSSRSVLLLTQHTQGFTHGLMVNAPSQPYATQSQLKWLCRAAGGEENYAALKSGGGFSYGGPSLTLVSVLHAKHDLKEPGVQLPRTLPDTRVFCGSSLKAAVDAMRGGSLGEREYRPFWGAKTWQKDKLDVELEQGMWIMAEAPANLALETDGVDTLWERLLLSMGPPFAELALIPEDVRSRIDAADALELVKHK